MKFTIWYNLYRLKTVFIYQQSKILRFCVQLTMYVLIFLLLSIYLRLHLRFFLEWFNGLFTFLWLLGHKGKGDSAQEIVLVVHQDK